MNGYRALIYSRVRENRLNPADSDITRGARQQAVMQALMSKLASTGTFFKLPFIGGDLMKPLATDLSPTEFIQLGWLKIREPARPCTAGSAAGPTVATSIRARTTPR